VSGFRFIHAADLHLDSPFAGLSGVPEAVRQVLRQSTFAALHHLTELAIRTKADFVLIAGDVYESADRSLRAQVRFHKAVERLAENGISAFVIHGNHDPADGREAKLSWPGLAHFFPAGQVGRIPVVLPGRGHVADVLGISYPSQAVRDNYAMSFHKEGEAPYHIGLLHANVDGASDHADYAPCTLRELLSRGMDYWALGHVHGRRVLHEEPYAVYPGNTQGRSIRETGPKGCYVVDVDEEGRTSLDFHELGAVRWEHRQVSIAGLTTEHELKERLESCLEEVRLAGGGRPSVLRLELGGRGPLHGRLQAPGFLRELADELRLAELERAGWGAASVGSSGLSAAGLLASDGPHTGFGSAAPGKSTVDFVWLEKLVDRAGAEADREVLASSPGFLGDVLRLAGEIGGDREELVRFASECMEPLLRHPKAGALLRQSGLAGDGGETQEDFAAECLEKAAEWLMDRLLAEEEGA
jgi:DNA repair protein SbcD/Mre11